MNDPMHVNGYDPPEREAALPNSGPVFFSPGMTLEALEQQAILSAYAFYRGVKTTTAQSLGISVKTLGDKLERYGQIDTERKSRDAEKAEHRARELHAARFGRPAVQTTESEHDEQAHGDAPYAGVRSQSAAKASEEQRLPLSEREKVQGVLHGKSSPHRSSGRR